MNLPSGSNALKFEHDINIVLVLHNYKKSHDAERELSEGAHQLLPQARRVANILSWSIFQYFIY